MTAPFLASLRELNHHADTLAGMAARGEWAAVTAEAPRHQALFDAFSGLAAGPLNRAEKDEARALFSAILEHYASFRQFGLPWLQDVGQLLGDLDKPV